MRGVLDALEALEALHAVHQPTPLDRVRRIIVIVVNSLSSPKTNWDQSESPPGSVEILLRATGVPIDHYSYEAIELLKDTAARWQTMRRLRAAAAFAGNKDPAVADALNVPDIDVYAINVSFPALTDKAELDVPERAAHDLRPAGRGRRPPARGRGDDPLVVARIQTTPEGRGRDGRPRAPGRRVRGRGSLIGPSAAKLSWPPVSGLWRRS